MIKVVAALIKKNGLILLGKRAKGRLKGLWEFPGGKIEQDEDIFDVIKREILEELQASIIPEKVIGTFSHKYSFDTIHLTLISCKFLNLKQEIVSDGSHADFAWIDPNDNKRKLAPLDQKILTNLYIE